MKRIILLCRVVLAVTVGTVGMLFGQDCPVSYDEIGPDVINMAKVRGAESALKVIDGIIRECPDYGDLYLVRALLLGELRRNEEAFASLIFGRLNLYHGERTEKGADAMMNKFYETKEACKVADEGFKNYLKHQPNDRRVDKWRKVMAERCRRW
jgi:hypothetical protein